MTFPSILKAVLSTYKVDCCYVADQLHIPDETVQGWLDGTLLPKPKEMQDFASGFAIPLPVVEEACKEK